MKLPKRSKSAIPLFSLIVIITIIASARGQGSIKVTGSVSDPLSVPIPGAHINLYSLDRILQTTSDSSGRFRFDAVPAGNYEFEVLVPGFKRFTKPGVFIGKSIVLTAVMEIGATGSPAAIIPATEVAPVSSCGPPDSVMYRPRKRQADALGGIVIDVYPKMPVARATLQLFDARGAKLAQQRTNERGEFQFKQTAPGRYYIVFQHPGYQNARSAEFWVAGHNATYITIQAVQSGKIVICQ
jgi:hypothetical protein